MGGERRQKKEASIPLFNYQKRNPLLIYNDRQDLHPFYLSLLLTTTSSLQLEVNNIHNGYRSIYLGPAALSPPHLHLTNYHLAKS